MKILSLFLLFSVIFSCAQEEEDVSFAFDLVGSSFKVIQYQELTVNSSWFNVIGSQNYVITDDRIRIDYDDYQETSSELCSGSVEYSYEILTKVEFENQLINASSDNGDFEEETYNIFTVYDKFLEDDGDNSSDIQNEEEGEEVVNNLSYYISSTIITNNVNSACPIIQPGNLLLFLKLYKNGDLEIINFNREAKQLATGF